MKRILFLLTFACTALFSACEYDDSALVDRMDGFESRLQRLEELCAQMNTNISSLQTIVNALQQKDFITTVAPINNDGKEVGYSITFSSGKSITIYHGNDGKDGEDGIDGKTPQIGVKQDADGVYYWTVDGEWLTDAAGAKIQATAEDGTDGENGTTPQLKIEEDYWYVSYDEGKTWTKLGKATGEDGSDGSDGSSGDNIFQSVTQDSENVYFVLTDGTRITIPKSASMENIVLTYIPRYSDGKATVVYTEKSDSYVEFDFEVSPASAAANWRNIATVKAVYTETRAGVEFVDMAILDWTTDTAKGTITVKASGKNLSDAFFAGTQDASARLVINGDAVNIISEYVPMVAKETVKLTEYVLEAVYETNKDQEIVYFSEIQGNSNPILTIDYGDGNIGNSLTHTYPIIGEYTVKFYFDKPLTEIRTAAFSNGTTSVWMKSVTIPNTVKKIGENAFISASLTQGKLKYVNFEPNSELEDIGDQAFANNIKLQGITIPSSVEKLGDRVFYGCSSIEYFLGAGKYYHLTITDSSGNGTMLATFNSRNKDCIVAYPAGALIKKINMGICGEIRNGAFCECNHLEDVNIAGLNHIYGYNFVYCDALQMFNLNYVRTIDGFVLSYCNKLQRIDAPLASAIGIDCFCNNESLTEIALGCYELKTINTIGNNNVSLQTIRIPAGVESINNSFNGCAAIAEVFCQATTPPTLTNSFDAITDAAKIYVPVGSGAAYKAADGWKDYADKIVGYDFETNSVVPEMAANEIWYTSTDGEIVTPYKTNVFGAKIVSNTYENGKGIIKFDGNVTTIGDSAFELRGRLTNITIPDSVKTIGDYAFENCTSLTNITIPDSVTTIGDYAFQYCRSLTNISIPNSVTTISDYAFYCCSNLTNLTVPDSVTRIGCYAFSNCSKLTQVVIGSNVKRIDYYAFNSCKLLNDITCIPITPPGVLIRLPGGWNAFYDIDTSAKIYVPIGSGNAYKAAEGWSDYASMIVEKAM